MQILGRGGYCFGWGAVEFGGDWEILVGWCMAISRYHMLDDLAAYGVCFTVVLEIVCENVMPRSYQFLGTRTSTGALVAGPADTRDQGGRELESGNVK